MCERRKGRKSAVFSTITPAVTVTSHQRVCICSCKVFLGSGLGRGAPVGARAVYSVYNCKKQKAKAKSKKQKAKRKR